MINRLVRFLVLLAFLGCSTPSPDPTQQSHGFGISPQGGTITSVTPTTGGGLTGGGAAGAVTIGLLTTCTSTQVLAWNGTAWACSAAGGLSGLTTNQTLKATSATTAGNAWPADDATTWGVASKFTITEASGNFHSYGTGTIDGLATLTGGFTLGADSSAGTHKITSLANGTVSSDAAAFGQIASGINTAVSGTSGTIPKFTGTNSIGNSSATDDGTTFTIGDTILAIGGNLRFTQAADDYIYSSLATSTGTQGLNINSSGTGKILFQTGHGGFTNAGTGGLELDGGGSSTSAVWSVSNAGNQVNSGTFTTNGNATIGNSTASNSHTANGRLQGTTTGFADGLAWSNAPTGAAFGIFALEGIAGGTIDTTAATRNSIGVYAVSSSTRSAGANNLVNYGLFASASGAQDNRALQTNDGNVLLNQSSGTTLVTGHGSTTGDLRVTDATTAVAASPILAKIDGTAATLDLATDHTLYGLYSDVRAPNGAGCGAPCSGQFGQATNIAVYGNAQGGDTNWAGYFNGGNVYVAHNITVDGLGQPPGGAIFTQNNETAVAADRSGVDGQVGGTSDATGAARSNWGIFGEAVVSRSAGTNAVTNYGVYGYASGGQNNYALYADVGDVVLNATSGTTQLKGAITNTPTLQNGASGYNGYASKYLEWTEDYLFRTGTSNGQVGAWLYAAAGGTGATGTTTDTAGAAKRPGIQTASLGTTATGRAGSTTSLAAFQANSGDVYTFEEAWGIPTLSNATDGFAALSGFFDTISAIDQVTGCYFLSDERQVASAPATGSRPAAGSNNLACVCASASTRTEYPLDGTTVSDESFTTVAVTAAALASDWSSGVLHTKVVFTSGTRAEFYTCSGATCTKVCDINSHLPTATFAAGHNAIKNVGTTSRTLRYDFSGVYASFTTPRT